MTNDEFMERCRMESCILTTEPVPLAITPFDDWALEDGDPALPGNDWFFVLSAGRTGSTFTRRMVSSHPEVYCGHEYEFCSLIYTMAKSEIIMMSNPLPHFSWGKHIEVTPTNLRRLFEAWRQCISDVPYFGDKMVYAYYQAGFVNTLLEVFPGAQIFVSTRNFLDMFSSARTHSWIEHYIDIRGTKEAFFQTSLQYADFVTNMNAYYLSLPGAIEIPFTGHIDEATFRETYDRIFAAIGVDAGEAEMDEFWAEAHHASALGRWKKDEIVVEFVKWVESHADSDEFLKSMMA